MEKCATVNACPKVKLIHVSTLSTPVLLGHQKARVQKYNPQGSENKTRNLKSRKVGNFLGVFRMPKGLWVSKEILIGVRYRVY